MARLTNRQKAETVFKLMLGLERASVQTALGPFGFSAASLDEGWALLRAFASAVADEPLGEPTARFALAFERFENQWFLVARRLLQRPFPRVAEALFQGFSNARGPEAILAVGLFVARLEQMERGESPFGKDGPAARALLEARGLNQERVAEAHALLDTLTKAGPLAPARPSGHEDEATAALWDYYLAWSTIARKNIREKRQLKALGLLSPKREEQSDEADIASS